ncbi:MAG: DUF4129 domain-containing protein, partial [Candidatus Eremiobacteraeota bacterium]|nr:DUF4129 domain-containing protein [Candidatus Eremiobacteraeota bacterium]
AGPMGEALAADANPDSLYERGLEAAASGRYAQAITLLFQASLLCFDAAGTVMYDASRTAGEYRRLIRRKAAPASPHFDTLAGAFTFVAYADGAPSSQDWNSAQSAFLALRPLASA